MRYQALVAAIAALRERYAAYLTGLAVAVADSFSRWAGAEQLRQGRLDFTDLLGRLRDLLRDDRDARRALQARFDYLLVDEFQDTDPLQSEIVFFLCEREPAGRATGATSSSSPASCSSSATRSSPSTASAAPTSRCTTK